MALLSRLEFASSDVYSPRGTEVVSLRSKSRTVALKNGKAEAVAHYAKRAARLARQGEFPGFFGAQVTLVPVCRSSMVVAGGLWVPMMLAQAMQRLGMGRSVSPLILRAKAVAKSASQTPEKRPTVQDHFDSMLVDPLAPAPTHVVLVDDVVTRGATLLAAASRVVEAYPNVVVRAYAVIRTMSGMEVGYFEDPCVGTIVPSGRSTHRDP